MKKIKKKLAKICEVDPVNDTWKIAPHISIYIEDGTIFFAAPERLMIAKTVDARTARIYGNLYNFCKKHFVEFIYINSEHSENRNRRKDEDAVD